MSSILKSLKKLEEEKASRTQGGSDVSREILQGELPRGKGKGGPNWVLLLLLLVIVGVGGAMLLRSEAPQPMVRTAPAAAPAEVATPPVSEPPAQAVPAEGEKTTTAQAQDVVAASKETAAVLKSTAAALQDTAAVLKDKVVVPKESVVTAPVASKPKKPSKPAPAPAPAKVAAAAEPEPKIDLSKAFPTPAPKIKPVPIPAEARTSVWSLANKKGAPKPVLKVSEIHWRTDVKERLAVVNDLPVMEGVVIDGAKVDRIFKDRIRFVVNGQYQEVLLSSER